MAATRWLSLLARLGLAAVWLISGWLKAVDPLQTVVAVRAYLRELARDVGFLLLAVWLVLRPESPGALGAGSRWERRVAS